MRLSFKLKQNMWTGSELIADIALAVNALSVLQPDLLSSIIQEYPRDLSNCPIVHAQNIVRNPVWAEIQDGVTRIARAEEARHWKAGAIPDAVVRSLP